MNLDLYYNLYNYLELDTIPDNFIDNEKKQLINQTRHYNKLLYRKNRKNPQQLLRVIKWNEVKPVLYIMYKHPTAEHLGTNAMYYKITEWYYWDQIYRDIQEYVKTCKEC